MQSLPLQGGKFVGIVIIIEWRSSKILMAGKFAHQT